MDKKMILGLVRHALTTFGGSTLMASYVTSDELTALVGSIITIIGFVWSFFAKKK